MGGLPASRSKRGRGGYFRVVAGNGSFPWLKEDCIFVEANHFSGSGGAQNGSQEFGQSPHVNASQLVRLCVGVKKRNLINPLWEKRCSEREIYSPPTSSARLNGLFGRLPDRTRP